MILCCSEALIDMLPGETAGGAPAFLPHPGGGALNTARALSRLGTPTGFLTPLSTDPFGEQLARALTDDGVDITLCPRPDLPTALAFVHHDGGTVRYSFHDAGSAGRSLSPNALPPLPGTIGALVFGGISLIHPPAADAYEALATREAPTRVIFLDPNIRPALVDDAAAYRARLGRMIGLADIVKLSDEDLLWLAGPGDPVAQARALLDRGPALVCLTRGAQGAVALTRDHQIALPAPEVPVADTVGAGDTVNAGLLTALEEAGALTKPALATLSEATLRDALSLAIRAAAVTVTRPGANPPTRSELCAR